MADAIAGAEAESSLMPHKGTSYDSSSGVTPEAGRDEDTPKLPSVLTDLDTRTGEFELGKYTVKVRQLRITDEAEKGLYETIAAKSKLICRDFTKKVKEIRVYNTGGKMPGQRTGRVDRHAIHRYKTSPDIFYNNTYKQLESDLAFGILLDISGSMHGNGITNGKITMILLHEALKSLGINHSIVGHTSDGWHDVDLYKFQSFREESGYNTFKNYALASIGAKYGNCDSGALYYMHQCIKRVRNRDKIVLIFSDGEPTECEEFELINQVKAMEADGIKVIGIGINFPNIAKYYKEYANGTSLKNMLDIVSNILQEYILKKGYADGN
jgi:cobalamin biosynthesis protein CobT